MERLIGYDIGGTKCSVVYGVADGDSLNVLDKVKFATGDVTDALRNLMSATREIIGRNGMDGHPLFGAHAKRSGPDALHESRGGRVAHLSFFCS